MVEPKETKDIKMDSIKVSEQNVRDPKDVVGLEDLESSILMYGVLQPIIVIEADEENKYELIIGQRRFKACKDLGKEEIPARIYKRSSLNDQDKMILSLSENIQRRPLNKGNEIKVITKLYDRLGSTTKVCQTLGISQSKVTESVNLDRFMTAEIQGLLNDELLNKSQLKAIIKRAEGDKERVKKSVKKAIKLIKKEDYIGKHRTRAYETAAIEPEISEREFEEKVEEQRYEDRIFIDLPNEYSKALKKVVKQTTGDIKGLILDIISNWLSERGLVEEK